MKTTLLLSLLAVTLFSSCCRDQHCPAFSAADAAQWIPQSVKDTIRFKNDANTTIHFIVESKQTTEAYSNDAHGGFFICPATDCNIRGSLDAQTTTSIWVPQGTYNIQMDGLENNGIVDGIAQSLYYQLGDFSGSFDLHPSIKIRNTETSTAFERDTIVSNLTLGSITYENVIIQSKNPLDTAAHNQIQKVYLSPGYGIVGFVSNQLLFYKY